MLRGEALLAPQRLYRLLRLTKLSAPDLYASSASPSPPHSQSVTPPPPSEPAARSARITREQAARYIGCEVFERILIC